MPNDMAAMTVIMPSTTTTNSNKNKNKPIAPKMSNNNKKDNALKDSSNSGGDNGVSSSTNNSSANSGSVRGKRKLAFHPTLGYAIPPPQPAKVARR